jgi:hypothetical protein
MFGIPAKFKLAWHYALGGRGVFVQIWMGVAAVDGLAGAGRQGGARVRAIRFGTRKSFFS